MQPDRRRAVSGYLETFVLVGVAVLGSGVIFGAASAYSSSVQGQSVSIPAASIRQGTYMAMESVTVFNSGQTAFSSFTVSTPQASSSTSYCYSLLNPSTMVTISSTCPTMSTNPRSVKVTSPLAPGSAILVELIAVGQAFSVGSSFVVVVTTSSGAQQSLSLQAVPA